MTNLSSPSLMFLSLLGSMAAGYSQQVEANPESTYRTPEETLKTFKLPPGFRMQLVASEPMIKEPVTIAWDGNGRMYVAQMETYMQDENGSKQMEPISRVMMLTDTNGDGKMDRSSVFIDKLVLPRHLLPLDDRVLVAETSSNKIFSYRDTNHDGVADEKILVYQGGAIKVHGNLEHQDSGLMWNLDNYIYTSMSWQRLRFTRGAMETEPSKKEFAQWGLTQDDMGRMFYSSAGMERPAFGFQMHRAYGGVEFKDQWEQGFMEPWPIIATPDVQGGPGRLRPDKTLNHFTGACGQTVFRGDNLPPDFYGNLFVCEPVARLVRRAQVTNQAGKLVLSHPYQDKKMEFIASSDRNFRPVHSATGPDGNLYIVDMYRGIIQEGNWVKGYLRERILETGLQKNVGRGRIWRVVAEKSKPYVAPKMLEQTPAQLSAHLSHPNGWWRDTAQKLLVLKRDTSVIPGLKSLTTSGKEPVGRMHALWTLEGMDVVDRDLLIAKFKDTDPRVRQAALRISERLLRQGDAALLEKMEALVDDSDPNVVAQLLLSSSFINDKALGSAFREKVRATKTQVAPDLFQAYAKNAEGRINGVKEAKLSKGATIYQGLCISCHGPEGKGVDAGGSKIAPPLAGSALANGDKANIIKVMLHGLTGPIDGKTYQGQLMIPMAQESDEWLADVLTEVRSAWGNTGDAVTPADVKKIREATKHITKPYTMESLLK